MTSNKDNFHVIQKWYINKAYDIDGEKVHSVQEWKVCGNVLPNPIIFTKLPVTVKVEYTVELSCHCKHWPMWKTVTSRICVIIQQTLIVTLN